MDPQRPDEPAVRRQPWPTSRSGRRPCTRPPRQPRHCLAAPRPVGPARRRTAPRWRHPRHRAQRHQRLDPYIHQHPHRTLHRQAGRRIGCSADAPPVSPNPLSPAKLALEVLDCCLHLPSVPRSPVVVLRQARHAGAASCGNDTHRKLLGAELLAQGQELRRQGNGRQLVRFQGELPAGRQLSSRRSDVVLFGCVRLPCVARHLPGPTRLRGL